MASRSAGYEDLATAFRHGRFEPLYLLSGEERFFVDRLQALALEHALAPHERDFNLDIVYGAESDIQQVMALCASYPVMAQRRLIVVRGFDRLDDNKRFQAYAQNPNPTAIVLLVADGKVNGSHHPYKAIREHGVFAHFKPLYERQLPRWIESEAKHLGYSIEPRAVQMLAGFVGTNLAHAVQELEKLVTFAGDRETITEDDVVQASGQTRECNVFELQKAIGSKRYSDAMRITERLLQQASNIRGEALMIVSTLTSYFTKLWVLTGCHARRLPENAMASRIGVPGYYLNEYLGCLRHFDAHALSQAFSGLAAADFELKGGSSRDERLVLGLLVRRLASVPAKPVLAA